MIIFIIKKIKNNKKQTNIAVQKGYTNKLIAQKTIDG